MQARWPGGNCGAQRIQWGSLEVLAHCYTGVILKLTWGPSNLSPGTWRSGITLKLARRPSNSSPGNPARLFVFIFACLRTVLFFFPSRNSLTVFLVCFLGKKNFAVIWRKISYLARGEILRFFFSTLHLNFLLPT